MKQNFRHWIDRRLPPGPPRSIAVISALGVAIIACALYTQSPVDSQCSRASAG